ncbi:amino acid adenylation domain-containing protein [Streptomyces bambusae]|uniref:amino acid adenylation domain-containing protein n=1 Tax=Streptomyces bambusae TaxID=1550616 RepID=UPI001CFD0212|nr:amino acid adenylation domain-containing protein [Streptomyces bambusae]MCB5167427.1 amino acid adenylation domain-containing protein [Streptomyces bambusae]
MDTATAAPGTGAPHSLVDVFTAVATAGPDRLAVSDETGRSDYRALDAWSRRIAHTLHTAGVRPGDRVALRMDAGRAAVAALLGILRAGAAYVPLDLRNPAERNAFIVADSGVRHLVGERDPDWGQELRHTGSGTVAALAEGPDRTGPETLPQPSGEDLAYVIYTSGTTGRPKGVPVRHASVVALLAAARDRFVFEQDDRWLLFHSLAFDFSVWELWGPLSTGAALVVPPQWVTRSPEDLVGLLADERISVLNQTPTAFTVLARAREDGGRPLPDLRYIVFGGEKLAPAALRTWAASTGLDHPRLVNMYGITEVTVHATFHRVTERDLDGTDSVIGTPLDGFAVRIAGPDGTEVTEPGVPGELWLSGPQVTAGYLNRPELNADRFPLLPAGPGGVRHYRSGDLVSRDTDGALVYHGRADLQVKLRGHRVELGDIEAAVRAHESVLDAVAWLRESADGGQRLFCVVLCRQGAEPDARALRRHVAAKLPSYMHPARYRMVHELPRTVNGKTDRAALMATWSENHG